MSVLGLLAVIACIGWNAGSRLRAMGRALDGILISAIRGGWMGRDPCRR
jgi:hypothetical protein